MRNGIDSLLTSILAPSTVQLTQEEFKLQTVYSGISDQIKPLKLVGLATEFKLESKFKPLLVIWQSLLKAVPEDNRIF